MSHLLSDHPDWPNASEDARTKPTPRTDAAIIRDKMILSEVGLLEIVDAGTCRQLERDLAAARERAQAAEARAGASERKIAAIVGWLEREKPDVFKRGLWDAIADGKPQGTSA